MKDCDNCGRRQANYVETKHPETGEEKIYCCPWCATKAVCDFFDSNPEADYIYTRYAETPEG